MAAAQTRFIIILVAILLAVAGASAAIVWLLPSSDPQPSGSQGPLPSAEKFDLRVLSRGAFTVLNHRLIQEGLLPVQPPAAVGKANPFL